MRSYEHEDRSRDEAERRPVESPEPEAAAVERLASSVGNQAFGVLAREGAGIMPDGNAHPDVTAALARTRGGGVPLDKGLRDELSGQLGDTFGDVRIHADGEADSLARSVSARAFTTGADVYFAGGEFNPLSTGGRELIAHELAHVVQQRGAPTSGPMRVSQPGEPLELDAEQAARGSA
jgi:Domain of unknown function (DUF4157)